MIALSLLEVDMVGFGGGKCVCGLDQEVRSDERRTSRNVDAGEEILPLSWRQRSFIYSIGPVQLGGDALHLGKLMQGIYLNRSVTDYSSVGNRAPSSHRILCGTSASSTLCLAAEETRRRILPYTISPRSRIQN